MIPTQPVRGRVSLRAGLSLLGEPELTLAAMLGALPFALLAGAAIADAIGTL